MPKSKVNHHVSITFKSTLVESAGFDGCEVAVIEVYTDGACSGNPGPGGWAWVVEGGSAGSGAENPSTNQRMELFAVLDALRNLQGQVHVFSDSTYVVKCFNDKWYSGWLRRGWKNAAGKPISNRDIWEPLIDLYLDRQHEIKFTWVKGHSGNHMNEMVDQMAVAAIRGAQ